MHKSDSLHHHQIIVNVVYDVDFDCVRNIWENQNVGKEITSHRPCIVVFNFMNLNDMKVIFSSLSVCVSQFTLSECT